MIRFSATVEGEKVFRRAFNRVGSVIDDLTPVWDEVETTFREVMSQQFRTSGAAGASGKWKELSAKYEETKPTDALIAGPMHLSFDLYKSLTRKTERAPISPARG